jgi:alpha-tubulin suppressor-like RCC1 family protein
MRADQSERPGVAFQAAISAGGGHTCALLTTGNVRCWGDNRSGQLGIGNTETIGDNEVGTTNVELGTTATAISAGGSHSCALLTGGAVRCWGSNSFGQLGLGNTTTIGDNETPTTNVNLGTPATAVAAGLDHTCALLTGGAVRCWGSNTFGQLGLGNTTTIGDNETPTTNVNLGTTATAITVGDRFTCAILAGDNVRCWGEGVAGKLGLGNSNTIGDNEIPTANVDLGGAIVTAISAGGSHACVILEYGAVRCWGYNASGQLGIGNTNNIGDDENPTIDVRVGLRWGFSKAIAITTGAVHTCALSDRNRVECWGNGTYGQLGFGNTTSYGDDEIPSSDLSIEGVAGISAGLIHSCAVLRFGEVLCWGNNSSGQLGLGNTTTIGDNENPGNRVQLNAPPKARAVTSGQDHSCALLTTGNVRCWGSNFSGQTGQGSKLPLIRPTTVNLSGATATALSAGTSHTCALLTDGNVRCWGDNSGQLGLGNTTIIGDNENPTTNVNLNGATATAISAGTSHTCALLTGGNVRCWGRNSYGELGLGNTTIIGDNENPTTNVNLNGATATAISAGTSHTCALLTGGNVRCWGRNSYGELGLGSTTIIGDNENPTTNVNLNGATATAISAGTSHTCALLTGGNVRCWGTNFTGELGLGNTTIIGDNENPTANVNLGLMATAIATGQGHTCALLSDGNVRCWGQNDFLQVGLGTFEINNIGDNENPTVNVRLDALATAISNGSKHSCAILADGNVRCWGNNAVGQLGVSKPTFDNDILNVTFDDVFVGPDEFRPVASITSPSPDQKLASTSVTITGTANDDNVIGRVFVAIYRYVNGGQYWNGATWQTTNTMVPATLTNPGASTSGWSYSFSAPGGVFAVAAVVYDASENYSIVPYQYFTISDPSRPTVSLAAPTPSQEFPSQPATITGSATDNIGVAEVRIVIYRTAGGGQFWDGRTWVSSYTTVTAELPNPGATTTTYTYVFDAPQSGSFYAAAIALDVSYNYSSTEFAPFTVPDSTKPQVGLTYPFLSPFGNQNANGTLRLLASAYDNMVVSQGGFVIWQASTAQYWNGARWQTNFAFVPGDLVYLGPNNVTPFSLDYTPPEPGRYYFAAIAIDGSSNYAISPFVPINYT